MSKSYLLECGLALSVQSFIVYWVADASIGRIPAIIASALSVAIGVFAILSLKNFNRINLS